MSGMDNATKIQAVINTLNLIKFDGTYDNANRLLGIHRTLMEVRDDLMKQKQEADEDVREADAE